MKLVLKLVFAEFRLHRVRMLLTLLSMVAAACVVVWVVGGYDALSSQFHESAAKTMGRYDLFVLPLSEKESSLSPGLVADLEKDTDVAEANPVMQAKVMLVPPGMDPNMMPPMMGMGGGRGGRGMQGGPGGARPEAGEAGAGVRGQRPEGMRGGRPGGRPGMVAGSAEYVPSGSLPAGAGGVAGAAKDPNAAPGKGMDPRKMFGSPSLVGTEAAEPPNAVVAGKWFSEGKDKRLE